MQKVPTSEFVRTQDCPKGCRGPSRPAGPLEGSCHLAKRWHLGQTSTRVPPMSLTPEEEPCLCSTRVGSSLLGLPYMNLDPGMDPQLELNSLGSNSFGSGDGDIICTSTYIKIKILEYDTEFIDILEQHLSHQNCRTYKISLYVFISFHCRSNLFLFHD